MNAVSTTKRRALIDGFTLVIAWAIAAFVAQVIGGHGDSVLAYRIICGWWAVLFACSKVEPKLRGLAVGLGLWLLVSAVDLFAHYGWLYPRAVEVASVEAVRLIALNGVFTLVVPFLINRTVNFVFGISIRRTPRDQPPASAGSAPSQRSPT